MKAANPTVRAAISEAKQELAASHMRAVAALKGRSLLWALPVAVLTCVGLGAGVVAALLARSGLEALLAIGKLLTHTANTAFTLISLPFVTAYLVIDTMIFIIWITVESIKAISRRE